VAALLTGAPARAADPVGPVLTAVSIDTTSLGPGQVAQLHYTATSADPLASVGYAYSGAAGSPIYPVTTDSSVSPALDGTVPVSFPQGARNADATLDRVVLTDTQGRSSTWKYDGAVTYAGGASGPATHQVSFTPATVTLSGFTEDRQAPVLNSIALASPSTLTVGDTLTLRYDVTDASLLAQLSVTLTNSLANTSRQLRLRAPDVPATGTVSAAIDNTWANGSWSVRSVQLNDRYLQYSSFGAGGPVDVGAVAFTVSGSTADYEPPVLTSIGPLPKLVARGGTIAIPYSTTDASGVVGGLTVRLRNANGSRFSVLASNLPLSGTLAGPVDLPVGTDLGTYWVEQVTLAEGSERRTYDDLGHQYQNGVRVADHAFDLAHLTTVVGTPPYPVSWAQATAGERALTVVWQRADTTFAPVTSYTITVSPSGRTLTVGPTWTRVTVTGLSNFTAYTATIRANSALGPSAPTSPAAVVPRPHGTRLIAPGDYSGDGHNDLLAQSPSGVLYLFRGNGRGGFASRGTPIARSFGATRILVPRTDPRGGVLSNIFWGVNYSGALQEFSPYLPLDPATAWPMSTGWSGMAKVVCPGDWSGDGYPDIFAIRDNGDLYYYRNVPTTDHLASGVRLGRGWGGYRQVLGAGDQNGDHHSDVLGLRSDGTLWLFPGNGRGGFARGGYKIGSGYGGARTMLSTDWNGDGRPDLLTVDSRGYLRWYAGTGHGHFTAKGVIGSGWGGYL
jgi:hypothetical protein